MKSKTAAMNSELLKLPYEDSSLQSTAVASGTVHKSA
jgi:hypothetical protein